MPFQPVIVTLGVAVLVAAFFVSLIAAIILGIGFYFSIEHYYDGLYDPAAGPLIRFGVPYAFTGLFLGIAALSMLRKRTGWPAAFLGCTAALSFGAYLLSQWPFTSRNFSWLPYAIFGIWTTVIVAGSALTLLGLLWLLRRRLTQATAA